MIRIWLFIIGVVLIFISFWLIVACLIAIYFNKKNYKYYKPTYEALASGKYVWRFGDDAFEHYYKIYHDDVENITNIISYNKKSGTIGLINGGYIIGDVGNSLDPYTLYYIIKFKKWFKTHGNRPYDESDYREYKLNQLL